MFHEYSTDQLIALRTFCGDVAEHLLTGKLPFAQKVNDVLQLVEYIDEELAARQRQKTA